MVRWLAPRLPAARLAAAQAVRGAIVAAVYGFVHDQVTFTISREYFLRLKFGQFPWLAEQLPPRLAAGAIGVAAAWWLGLIGWWLLARVVLLCRAEGFQRVMLRSVMVVVAAAAVSAVIGGVVAPWIAGGAWAVAVADLGVRDVRGFTVVAGVHWGSYAGAAGAWLYLVGTQLVQAGKECRRYASSGKI